MIDKIQEKNFKNILENINYNKYTNLNYNKLCQIISINTLKEKNIKNNKNLKKINIELENLLPNIIKYLNSKQIKTGEFEFGKNKEDIIKFSPIDYLLNINKYLIKNPSDIKKNLKYIQKSIEYLENNFDNLYLLIKNNFKTNKYNFEFSSYENAKILNLSETLSDLLNQYDYTNLADRIFLLKGKIELGFQRYFINNEFKKIIIGFNSNGKYKIANKKDIILTLKYYSPSRQIIDNYIKDIKKEFEKTNEFNIKLDILSILKEYKIDDYNKNYNKIKNDLEFQPRIKLKEKEFNQFLKISKSINKKYNINFKNTKNNQILVDLNNLSISLKINKLISK